MIPSLFKIKILALRRTYNTKKHLRVKSISILGFLSNFLLWYLYVTYFNMILSYENLFLLFISCSLTKTPRDRKEIFPINNNLIIVIIYYVYLVPFSL